MKIAPTTISLAVGLKAVFNRFVIVSITNHAEVDGYETLPLAIALTFHFNKYVLLPVISIILLELLKLIGLSPATNANVSNGLTAED